MKTTKISAAVLRKFEGFASALEQNLPLVPGMHHSDPYWIYERADWERLKAQGEWPKRTRDDRETS